MQIGRGVGLVGDSDGIPGARRVSGLGTMMGDLVETIVQTAPLVRTLKAWRPWVE